LFFFKFYTSLIIFKNFIGNTNGHDTKINQLPIPIVAQFVRINPKEWNNLIALGIELYGCKYGLAAISFTKTFIYTW